MATRSKTKPTIVDTPFVETVTPEAVAPDSAFFERLQAELGIKPGVSWQRAAIGMVSSLLVTGILGYFAGYLVAYLSLAALLLSGSAFITAVVYVLGMLAMFYMGYRVGPIVYVAVIDKKVDTACSTAWGWVTSRFGATGVAA